MLSRGLSRGSSFLGHDRTASTSDVRQSDAPKQFFDSCDAVETRTAATFRGGIAFESRNVLAVKQVAKCVLARNGLKKIWEDGFPKLRYCCEPGCRSLLR